LHREVAHGAGAPLDEDSAAADRPAPVHRVVSRGPTSKSLVL
jgi:hypothetical protein